MGKISEIIGKRSQNVTGEVMVEVGIHQAAVEDAVGAEAGDAHPRRAARFIAMKCR